MVYLFRKVCLTMAHAIQDKCNSEQYGADEESSRKRYRIGKIRLCKCALTMSISTRTYLEPLTLAVHSDMGDRLTATSSCSIRLVPFRPSALTYLRVEFDRRVLATTHEHPRRNRSVRRPSIRPERTSRTKHSVREPCTRLASHVRISHEARLSSQHLVDIHAVVAG